MSAIILPWPRIARPVPVEGHPLYRLGVDHFLASCLRARGTPPLEAMDQARHMARTMVWNKLDDLPANAGEGEC